ncbi:hypothetical protein [Chryseobacterium sp. SIMBA_038]|uniref:hypothetical protein n=1 Tax=Chryseobacterium sp. SIMBA_038 TaxID=3085780 RepID=UPI00397E3C6A
MSQLLIIGDNNPEIGKETKYTISLVNFGGLSNNINVFNPISEIPQWQILVLEHGKWRKTSENTKQGESVSYTFKQSSLSREGIKLVVTKGNDKGELIIKTKRAGQPKILKVDLLDVNYNKVTKPLHYFDTLIAKAQCTDMEGEKLHFTLWEDDALKEGHNKINEINKINPIPISATVKRGKAEARFNMAFYTQASMIANMQLAKGDKSEGKNHEYYVTANYYGKLEASNNINITNPAFENPIQKAYDLKYPEKKQQKPKVNKRLTPPLPAPKKDTYKIPITPKAKTKAPDPKGKIISVEFVDFLGKPYQNMKFGTQVKAKILSKDMKGKTIKLKIWEDDISDQLVYENNYVLAGDESYATLNLTNEMRKKGDDFKEGSEQEYFLEIEYAGQSVDSEVINVNDSAPKIKVETGVSTSGVKQKTVQKQQGTCICQEQYKDLIWGGKVSCEFRKKVVEICAELWGESRKMEMANGLMAVMNVETWGTFKAHHREGYKSADDNPKELTISSLYKEGNSKSSRAIGLIQFTQDALEGMSEFPPSTSATRGTQARYDSLNKLKLSYAQMGEIRQLDKVKKYFTPAKNKIKTPEDIYLHVFAPNGVGKDDNYLLYSKGTVEYSSNASVDKNNNGIQRSEILARFHKSRNEGLGNKTLTFTCGIDNKKQEDSQATDIITYHIYIDGRIEKNIPKKIKAGFEKKYKYIYHDNSGNLHDLGTYDIIPTQLYHGAKGLKVNLINLENVKKSYKKGIYQYLFNVDSPRTYVNEKTLASFLGAMLDVNYLDISCNGFSHSDGSSRPSVSHINGNNGDFKYLRKDKKLMFGDGTSLDISKNPDMLDDVRQNLWIDALYKFGWKSMLGWTYRRNGKTNHLHHLPKNTDDHNHHLHLQGYKPNFKEIKE